MIVQGSKYLVELHIEHNYVLYEKVIVPYNIAKAMKRLSLKRKIEDEERKLWREVRRRLCCEVMKAAKDRGRKR